MSDAPPLDRETEDRIGLELCRARPKTVWQFNRDMGMAAAYVLGFVLFPIIGFVLAGGVILGLGKLGVRLENGSPAAIASIGASFIFFTGLLFWFAHILPNRDFFVLHERGLRYRMGWKRAVLAFDELARIRIGVDLPGYARAAMALNKVSHPGVAEMGLNAYARGLTFELRSGKKVGIPALLIRYDTDEIDRLLDLAKKRAPTLFTG